MSEQRANINVNIVVTVCASLTILGGLAGVWNTVSSNQARTDVRITADEASWQRQFDTENARIIDLERWRESTTADLASRREANAADLMGIKDSIADMQRSLSDISAVLNTRRHADAATKTP